MIYILIPIHNRCDITLACLRSLNAQTYTTFTIIIIDAGSNDHSVDMIRTHFKNVSIIQGTQHWWWTRCMNEAVAQVLQRAADTDTVLLLNDDTEMQPSYLETLTQVHDKYPNAIIGSILKNYYDDHIQDAGVQADWHTFSFPKGSYNPLVTINDHVDALSGRGTLIPITVFKKIGLFRRVLSHYAADYDFSIRAKKAGFQLLLSNEAIIYSKDKPGSKNRTFWSHFFSKRSSGNLWTHTIFALLDAPTMLLKLRCLIVIYGRFLMACLALRHSTHKEPFPPASTT